MIEALTVADVASFLTDYVDHVAPSVRKRIAAMAGVDATQRAESADVYQQSGPEPIEPVACAEDALALYLSVLEDPRDPFDVERALDGISRFGAALASDQEFISPLRKRANQLCTSRSDSTLRLVLALTGKALSEGHYPEELGQDAGIDAHRHTVLPDLGLRKFHLARSSGILDQVAKGHALPLMSLPSDTSGMVSADDLFARMALYQVEGDRARHRRSFFGDHAVKTGAEVRG